MMLQFVVAFIDCATRFAQDAPMTVVRTKYSELVHILVGDWGDEKSQF